MLYLIKFQNLAKLLNNLSTNGKHIEDNDESGYDLFETHTESILKVGKTGLIEILEDHRLEAKNIHINNGKIQIKDWPNSIQAHSSREAYAESEYILLGRLSDNWFKVVNTSGEVEQMSEARLKQAIDSGEIANCDVINGDERIYRSTDTYKMNTDPKFEADINKKYTEFTAKSALLGLHISFDYEIENNDVKIIKYTGKSPKAIIPSFVTTICKGAFQFSWLKQLTLNNGLKYIGNEAFTGNSLKCVELPETVEFVGQSTFGYDGLGVNSSEKYKKLNPNTLIVQ